MPINLDGEPHNADWTKVTPDLPATRQGLLRYLASQHMTLDEFKRLPVYEWNHEHFDRLLEAADAEPASAGTAADEARPARDPLRNVDYETLLAWQARILTGRPMPDDLVGDMAEAYRQFAKELDETPRRGH